MNEINKLEFMTTFTCNSCKNVIETKTTNTDDLVDFLHGEGWKIKCVKEKMVFTCKECAPKKPPLGVIPFDIFIIKRVFELQRALREYIEYNRTNILDDTMQAWKNELTFWEQIHKLDIFQEGED